MGSITEKVMAFCNLQKKENRIKALEATVHAAASMDSLMKHNGWRHGFMPIYNQTEESYRKILLYGDTPEKRESARVALLALDKLIKNVETTVAKGVKAYETAEQLKKES